MATTASGANAQILIQKETTWGVKPAVPKMLKLTNILAGEGLGVTIDSKQSQAITGGRGVEEVRNAGETINGQFSGEVSAASIKLLMDFYGVLGEYVQTTEVDGKFKKVFTRASDIPSFYIEKNFPDIDVFAQYFGVKYNTVTVAADADGDISITNDYIGKSHAVQDSPFDSAPLVDINQFMTGIDVDLLSEGGIASCYSNINFAITNDLETRRCLGPSTITAAGVKRGSVTGSVTFSFENMNYYDKWIDETETTIRFRMKRNDNTIEFLFPRIRITGTETVIPTIDSDGLLTATFPFISLNKSGYGTNGSDVVVTVISDVDFTAFLATA